MPRTLVTGVAAIALAMAAIALSLALVNASSQSEDRPPRGAPNVVAPPATGPRPAPREDPRAVVARTPAAEESGPGRRTTTVAATVEPAESVEVLTDVSGHIGRLAVDIGAIVHRGDLLAEIEAPDRNFALAKARVALEQARARIATTKAEMKVADSAVQTARAELESSQAELQQSQATSVYRKRQYERIAELVKKGALQNRIGEEEKARIRGDEAGEVAARAKVAITRAALLSAEAKLEAAGAELGEREQDVRLAEVELEEARMRREACRIHAPIDGVVIRRYHHAGEFVRSAAGGAMDPLFTIVQARVVRIVANVPDRDAALVAVGDPATFRPDAPPRAEYAATLSRTSVAEDPSTQTIRIEVDLDNGAGRLRPGQRGSLRIDHASRP